MTEENLQQQAERHLHTLCIEIDNRRTGSEGNRNATSYFAEQAAARGFRVQSTGFDCMDWREHGVSLKAGGETFKVHASPYSPGCRLQGELVPVASMDQLGVANLGGKIALLHGEIAQGQLMPKNFFFYNPEEHQRIIQLLEVGQPLAIIAATGRDPEMVGAMYPFPLFEDGDFDIPSVYMTDVDGERLLKCAGQRVALDIRAERIPARGYNIIARKGAQVERRVVLFAHIDAKQGTPGALDNAAGVTSLLLLAGLLRDYKGQLGIELVAMNGEDYYAIPGQRLYMEANEGAFDQIVLGINIDGAGYHKGHIAWSLYECPPEISALIESTMAEHPDIIAGDPWYQGDHGMFLMQNVPALAFTSELLEEVMTEVVHQATDTPAIIDAAKLVELAHALYDLLQRLDRYMQSD